MFSQETVVIGLLKYSLGIDDEKCTQGELEFAKELVDLSCMFSSDGNCDEMVFNEHQHVLVIGMERDDNIWSAHYSLTDQTPLSMSAVISTGTIDDHYVALSDPEMRKLITMTLYPIIKYFLDKVGIEVGEGNAPLIDAPLH